MNRDATPPAPNQTCTCQSSTPIACREYRQPEYFTSSSLRGGGGHWVGDTTNTLHRWITATFGQPRSALTWPTSGSHRSGGYALRFQAKGCVPHSLTTTPHSPAVALSKAKWVWPFAGEITFLPKHSTSSWRSGVISDYREMRHGFATTMSCAWMTTIVPFVRTCYLESRGTR